MLPARWRRCQTEPVHALANQPGNRPARSMPASNVAPARLPSTPILTPHRRIKMACLYHPSCWRVAASQGCEALYFALPQAESQSLTVSLKRLACGRRRHLSV